MTDLFFRCLSAIGNHSTCLMAPGPGARASVSGASRRCKKRLFGLPRRPFRSTASTLHTCCAPPLDLTAKGGLICFYVFPILVVFTVPKLEITLFVLNEVLACKVEAVAHLLDSLVVVLVEEAGLIHLQANQDATTSSPASSSSCGKSRAQLKRRDARGVGEHASDTVGSRCGATSSGRRP